MIQMKRNRARGKATARWQEADKDLLLKLIMQNPEKFEKPTAQIFYKNILDKYEQFKVYDWAAMRDKLRNLRRKYSAAIYWRDNTGNDLKGENAERTIRQNILKLCPDFDALDNIFREKTNKIPVLMHDSGTSSYSPIDQESLGEEDLECLIEESPIDDLYTQETIHSTPFRSIAQNSAKKTCRQSQNFSTAFLEQAQRAKTEYLRERLLFEKETEEKRLKVEDEKISIEREKINFEKEKFKEENRLRELEIKNNFELQKMKIEKEMALKEKELELKYKNV